jgi:hypothetical protein
LANSLVYRFRIGSFVLTSSGQSTITYTVDSDFSTGETLRSKTSVFDIYPLEDGGFFLGGGFNMIFTNPDSPFMFGLAMIDQQGDVHPNWGGGASGFARELFDHEGGYIHPTGETLTKTLYTGESWYLEFGDTWGDYYKVEPWGIGNNPYTVRWTQDIFILEDQSVLIGGAIATDTLQPGLFRHLMRLLPDGSHDDTFPIIEAMPQGLNTHISKIERASDGSWYVSGRFQGINGHISPHIAHLTADFEVDTDFVSPFYYESYCCALHTEMKLLDSQDRIWIGGRRVRLSSNPNEYLQLVRLLPSGELDESFTIGKVNSDAWIFGSEQPPLVSGVFELENGDFIAHGSFSEYNDTSQLCITVLDDFGSIQQNYFNGEGATINYYDPDDENEVSRPNVNALELLEDGSLMVGGAFSDFMGVERYSMVKLNPGTLGTDDPQNLLGALKLWPNPAQDQLYVELPTAEQAQTIQFIDGTGRTVLTLANERVSKNRLELDLSPLPAGFYLLRLTTQSGEVYSGKLVVE